MYIHTDHHAPQSHILRMPALLVLLSLLSLTACGLVGGGESPEEADARSQAAAEAARQADNGGEDAMSDDRTGEDTGADAGEAASPAKATFGGGCFWCTEAVFEELEGVSGVVSGYAGGDVRNPTYKQVCAGTTGHAEVVQVTYDPSVVTYAELLEVFFRTHDPTTLNRQGADVGTQYRSIILAHDAEQRAIAEEIKKSLDESGAWDKPIVTEVTDLETFWPAEDHHQDYYAKNPDAGYCAAVIAPKMEKFRKAFSDRLKD